MSGPAEAVRRLQAIERHLTSGAGPDPMWGQVPQAPPDPILGVTEAWKTDTDHRKLNLGVGAYRTDEAKPLVLRSVRKAEQRLVRDTTRNKEYLPIGGDATFCTLSQQLAFGADSPALQQHRVATVQSLSGTGALRVGGEFLASFHSTRVVYLPNPTWGNHKAIFSKAGHELRQYRYFDPVTKGLDYQGMMSDLGSAPRGAIVLLHACAHNPTGVDPSLNQWQGILNLVQQKQLLPFFDSAYQGFASGDLDADARALRMFVDGGVELLLAQSYAKNMGLYGERVGALSVVCSCPEAAKRVESQLKATIRPMYSSPPGHGAAIAALVLSDPGLKAEWRGELADMAGRIKEMREALYETLRRVGAPGNWSHIVQQIGMFSFTGLTRSQCQALTSKWHVYLTLDGRISMAGLTASKVPYLAEAIKDVLLTA